MTAQKRRLDKAEGLTVTGVSAWWIGKFSEPISTQAVLWTAIGHVGREDADKTDWIPLF